MKTRFFCSIMLLISLTLMLGCMQAPPTNQPANANAPVTTAGAPPELKAGFDAIQANDIMQHTRILSSDEYEGRGPGTKGEELTVKYLEDAFRSLGLKPGNTDGTYIQKVPMVGITGANTVPLTVTKGATKRTFKWSDEVVAWTKHVA